MPLILIFLRFALGVIFGVAGVTKLFDWRRAREAVINFGVPSQFVTVVTFLLPLAELAIAIGLSFSRFARLSALAAFLLLLIFAVMIGINLLRGRAPECHCFGQLYSRPLGWPTLLRNLAFASVAGFIFWRKSVSGDESIAAGLTTPAQLAYLVVVLGAVTMALFFSDRKKKIATQQDHDSAPRGLPLGFSAPIFDLASYEGGRGSLEQLLGFGKPLLLIFTNPNCGPCVSLFEEVGKWQRRYCEQITIAPISQGTIKENFVNISRNSLENVLLQQEREVAEAYQSTVTPTAVLINVEGKIASRVAGGTDEIRKLLNATLGTASTVELSSQLGEPALSA